MSLSAALLASLLSAPAQANDSRQHAQGVREELEVIEDDRQAPGTDGGLTLAAFREALKQSGSSSGAKATAALFNEKDADKDGVVSHQEACGSASACQWRVSTGGADISFDSPGWAVRDSSDEAQ